MTGNLAHSFGKFILSNGYYPTFYLLCESNNLSNVTGEIKGT